MIGAAIVALLAQVAPAARPIPVPSPSTDVYLASLGPATDGTIRVGVPEAISKNPGYDNQPYFTRGGESVMFTSMLDGKQTDVYEYTIASRALKPLATTPESEYSPTPAPDGRISVIRVEPDGTQRLWAFAAEGGTPSVVLPDVKPVGYHAWADASTLVLFVLGEPPTLQLADVRTGKAEPIAQRPGRCLARTPDGKISFVQKGAAREPWRIVELDVATKTMTPVTEAIAGREDYAWLPDGRLLMASGPKIFLWDKDGRVKVWQQIADLASDGIDTITRLAVSPDGKRLALVGETTGQTAPKHD